MIHWFHFFINRKKLKSGIHSSTKLQQNIQKVELSGNWQQKLQTPILKSRRT